jgi:hypothetical protein
MRRVSSCDGVVRSETPHSTTGNDMEGPSMSILTETKSTKSTGRLRKLAVVLTMTGVAAGVLAVELLEAPATPPVAGIRF